MLLLLYQLVAEENGADARELRGTIQNDVLKEYVARGNYIYPPVPSMRLTTDTFAYCDAELPRWNTISISGYHIREAGSTAVQEVAFTLANGIAYVEAALAAGLDVNRFGPRLSFFFNAHNNLMEEVAKFRAARSLWAHIMRDRFGATEPRAMALRFHAQTGGSTLTAQQPRNNVVRVAVQVLARRPSAARSRSTPTASTRRWRCPPRSRRSSPCARSRSSPRSRASATRSTRSAAATTSRSLTAEIEERARELIAPIDARGGAVECIEFMREAIGDAAFRHHEEVASGERVVIGVNAHREDDEQPVSIHRIDPADRDRPGRAPAPPARGARRRRGERAPVGGARSRPAAPPTCCRRCARPCARGRPWARCAACCARSTASTTGSLAARG